MFNDRENYIFKIVFISATNYTMNFLMDFLNVSNFSLTWPDYPSQRSLGGGITRFFRVFIKYCVFSLKCCVFSELCQFCCSAGVLPSWCVYTH